VCVCVCVCVCGQLARPDGPELQLAAAEPRNRFTAKRMSCAVKHVAYCASSCQYKAMHYWFEFWKYPCQDTDSHLLSEAQLNMQYTSSLEELQCLAVMLTNLETKH